MCLGIPMQVLRTEGLRAWCEYKGETRAVDLSLVGPVEPGTWLMTFLDAAREVIDEATARKSLAALEAVEAVMSGLPAEVEHLFADLVEREPQLPPHLQALVNEKREEGA